MLSSAQHHGTTSRVLLRWRVLYHCAATAARKTAFLTKLLPGDLTNESDVERIIEKTVAEFGRLDILVNNAGILQMGSIETTSLQQYDQVMNTNMR